MRWHVLKGLIKDYQLQQPRLVELGVERGFLSERLLEVWLSVTRYSIERDKKYQN